MLEHARTRWRRQEIEAIVGGYFDVLMIELAGGTVVKAEPNWARQTLTGRSHGSIEYKHQDISAVMAKICLPVIRGNKSAMNYQYALVETVNAHLCPRGLHDRLSSTAAMGPAWPAELAYQPASALSSPQKQIDPDIHRIIRRYDPALREARARAIGEAGEELVFHAERNRLSSSGSDDLAANVGWVTKEAGDGDGYDILSFSRYGRERWLEVKTTKALRRRLSEFRRTNDALRKRTRTPSDSCACSISLGAHLHSA